MFSASIVLSGSRGPALCLQLRYVAAPSDIRLISSARFKLAPRQDLRASRQTVRVHVLQGNIISIAEAAQGELAPSTSFLYVESCL